MNRIPLSYTSPDPEKLSAILRRYAGVHHNKMIEDFEASVCKVTGVRYAVALNSGTAAIHLGLKLLGVGKGDEVIVSTFTYVATVNPILYLGAKPVFVDSEYETWNMDPALLEQAIKDRLNAGIKPKAIVIVHSYGIPAKMPELMAIADAYGIPVLEDAAEAFGSTLDNHHVGSMGAIGILSFNTNKLFTTYGGGALLTNDEVIHKKAIFLAEQARENKPFYEYKETGYNYRMSPLTAACGLAQIDQFSEILVKRKEISLFYRAELEPFGFVFLKELPGFRGNHWLTTTVLTKGRSKEIINGLVKEGIEARFFWNPMHKQPVFSSFDGFLSGISEGLFERGICLPSSQNLTNDELQSVIQTLKRLKL